MAFSGGRVNDLSEMTKEEGNNGCEPDTGEALKVLFRRLAGKG